jgi:ribosomal protein L15
MEKGIGLPEDVIDYEHLALVHAEEIGVIEYKVNGNKVCEVNLDTICENFEDGDVVDLKALKMKRLINPKAGRVKILARGVMTKSLTIYADKFSLQAVKMITLAGGHADQYK